MRSVYWIAVLVSICLASCGTVRKALTYSTPPWGSSTNPVEVADIPSEAGSGDQVKTITVLVVPARNSVLVRFGDYRPNWEFPDRMGSITTLKRALAKFQEWESKIGGTGATVSKEISRNPVWMNNAQPALQYHIKDANGKWLLENDGAEVLYSLVTDSNGSYQFQMKFSVLRPTGDFYPADASVEFKEAKEFDHYNLTEQQVADLLASLDESAFHDKVAEADSADKARQADTKQKADANQQALQALQ